MYCMTFILGDCMFKVLVCVEVKCVPFLVEYA